MSLERISDDVLFEYLVSFLDLDEIFSLTRVCRRFYHNIWRFSVRNRRIFNEKTTPSLIRRKKRISDDCLAKLIRTASFSTKEVMDGFGRDLMRYGYRKVLHLMSKKGDLNFYFEKYPLLDLKTVSKDPHKLSRLIIDYFFIDVHRYFNPDSEFDEFGGRNPKESLLRVNELVHFLHLLHEYEENATISRKLCQRIMKLFRRLRSVKLDDIILMGMVLLSQMYKKPKKTRRRKKPHTKREENQTKSKNIPTERRSFRNEGESFTLDVFFPNCRPVARRGWERKGRGWTKERFSKGLRGLHELYNFEKHFYERLLSKFLVERWVNTLFLIQTISDITNYEFNLFPFFRQVLEGCSDQEHIELLKTLFFGNEEYTRQIEYSMKTKEGEAYIHKFLHRMIGTRFRTLQNREMCTKILQLLHEHLQIDFSFDNNSLLFASFRVNDYGHYINKLIGGLLSYPSVMKKIGNYRSEVVGKFLEFERSDESKKNQASRFFRGKILRTILSHDPEKNNSPIWTEHLDTILTLYPRDKFYLNDLAETIKVEKDLFNDPSIYERILRTIFTNETRHHFFDYGAGKIFANQILLHLFDILPEDFFVMSEERKSLFFLVSDFFLKSSELNLDCQHSQFTRMSHRIDVVRKLYSNPKVKLPPMSKMTIIEFIEHDFELLERQPKWGNYQLMGFYPKFLDREEVSKVFLTISADDFFWEVYCIMKKKLMDKVHVWFVLLLKEFIKHTKVFRDRTSSEFRVRLLKDVVMVSKNLPGSDDISTELLRLIKPEVVIKLVPELFEQFVELGQFKNVLFFLSDERYKDHVSKSGESYSKVVKRLFELPNMDIDKRKEIQYKLKLCTFYWTGEMFRYQHTYRCLTCTKGGEDERIVICAVCKDKCHKGHKVERLRKSMSYCDCFHGKVGHEGCKAKLD